MKPKIELIETPKIKATGWKVETPKFTTLVMDENGSWHMLFKANLSAKKVTYHLIN